MIPLDRSTEKTVSRSLPDRTFIMAIVGLNKLGQQAPYWTATAAVYEPHGTWSGHARWRHDREPDSGGAVHEDILHAWPSLAPVVALHLSDAQGVPMHALANGRYFLEQGDPEAAARLWRCSLDELPTPEGAEAFVEAQRERWADESARAWEVLESL